MARLQVESGQLFCTYSIFEMPKLSFLSRIITLSYTPSSVSAFSYTQKLSSSSSISTTSIIKFEGLEEDNEVKKIEKTDNQDEKIKSKNNVQNEIDTPTLNPISFGEACSKKEKKIFKYLLRIMFAVNLINEKMAIETILKDFTSLSNDAIVNELTSRIFNEIKNENNNQLNLF